MKIAVFGNNYRSENKEKACRILYCLYERGTELLLDEPFYYYLKSSLDPLVRVSLIKGNYFEADIALSMGGDGTFLRTAMRVGNKGIPILGINMGHLGFLADVSSDEIDEMIRELLSADYRIEERALLHLDAPSEELIHPDALNEIAILKQDTSSMLTIHVELNGNYLNTYWGDGLIISTPTGSTAYSLSVGGPILVPQSKMYVLSPVAPHSLNARPLVITDDNEITLTVSGRSNRFLVALDGRSIVLETSTKLVIRKADYAIRVIKRKGATFYDTLREKLMWGVDVRP